MGLPVPRVRCRDHACRPDPQSPGCRGLAVPLDVTGQAQIDAAVRAATGRFGRINVLVNNAGRGLLGAVEEATDAEIRPIYDVNVFAMLAVTRAVLPVMRAARHGTVVNLSSIGGFASSPGWGIYASTKFAIEAFTEVLRDELAPLGVTAVMVEPGYFSTDFLDSSSLHVSSQIEDSPAGPPARCGALRPGSTTPSRVTRLRAPGPSLRPSTMGRSPSGFPRQRHDRRRQPEDRRRRRRTRAARPRPPRPPTTPAPARRQDRGTTSTHTTTASEGMTMSQDLPYHWRKHRAWPRLRPGGTRRRAHRRRNVRNHDRVVGFEALAPGRAHALVLDVTDEAAIPAAVERAEGEAGLIDVLVNNAGCGVEGTFEETPIDVVRAQFEVNVFGTVAVTRAALPCLRQRRAGTIVFVTSMGGLRAFPGISAYHGSKYAVEGIADSLRQELAALGIHVMSDEPGGFRTDWAGRSMTRVDRSIDDYDKLFKPIRENRLGYSGRQLGDPAKAGAALLGALDSPTPPGTWCSTRTPSASSGRPAVRSKPRSGPGRSCRRAPTSPTGTSPDTSTVALGRPCSRTPQSQCLGAF